MPKNDRIECISVIEYKRLISRSLFTPNVINALPFKTAVTWTLSLIVGRKMAKILVWRFLKQKTGHLISLRTTRGVFVTEVPAGRWRKPGRESMTAEDSQMVDEYVHALYSGQFAKSELKVKSRSASRAARRVLTSLNELVEAATTGKAQPITLETYQKVVERTAPLAIAVKVMPEMPQIQYKDLLANGYHEVQHLASLGRDRAKGHLLEREALRCGQDTLRFDRGAIAVRKKNGKLSPFAWSRSNLSTAASLAICCDKQTTRSLLTAAGVPTPAGRRFGTTKIEEALHFAETLGFPVVFKPATGARGIGVVANIKTAAELRNAYDKFSQGQLSDDDFIIEKHVFGQDYRIVVINGQVVAALLRLPASVKGSGIHTVGELIYQKSAVRNQTMNLCGGSIDCGPDLIKRLYAQDLNLLSIPDRDNSVILADSCSLSQGGDSIDVLDELHPSIKKIAIDAVQAIPGLNFCGVDFLIENHQLDAAEQSCGICELNAHASLANIEFPLFGESKNIASQMLTSQLNLNPLEQRNVHETISTEISIFGQLFGPYFTWWLKKVARTLDVKVEVVDSGTGKLTARCTGAIGNIAVLNARIIKGPRGAQVESLQTRIRSTSSLPSSNEDQELLHAH